MTISSDVKAPAIRWTALDGLRGIMTLFVFLAHIDYDLFPGSIIYMDTFFIMSSFLITRLLFKDWQISGFINFKKFYIRRAKRLFPALVLLVLATIPFTYFYLSNDDQILHVFGALFYFSNWLRALGIPHNGILGHTWSLSIEEQYYLIWPVLFALCLHKQWQGRKLLLLMLTICIASASWRAYLALNGATIDRTYNGTDVRLDSLALGVIFALNYNTEWMQKCFKLFAKIWLIWLLLIAMAIGGAIVDYRDVNWYVWQQPCYELISLALMIGLLQRPENWGLKIIFQNPVSVYLGTICYGIYLWHYPVLVFGTEIFHLTNWSKALFCGGITLALASLSYHFVEKPLLNAK